MCQCKSQENCPQCNTEPERQPHKHAALIREWVLDTSRVVQYKRSSTHEWADCEDYPAWIATIQYRFKPEPKPDVVIYSELQARTELGLAIGLNRIKDMPSNNVIITFDGETGKLKSVEIIK